MPRPKGSFKTPSLTLHKPSGRARVCIDGHDRYCGVYGTPEAQQKYERLIAEWVLRSKQPAADEATASAAPSPTVSQIIAAFWHHAQAYYRKPDGTPTSEVDTRCARCADCTAVRRPASSDRWRSKRCASR